MKSICPALFMMILLLSACNSNGPSSRVDPASRVKIAMHSFSDTATKDTFKLVLAGDKPKDMVFTFTIRPADSRPIYTKVILAKDLLGNYGNELDLDKTKKQIKFLNDEMQLFFQEENFLDPAVTENETPDKNTPDQTFFNELKRSGVAGFQYRLGKESKVYIAWSATSKSVKPYYNCCH